MWNRFEGNLKLTPQHRQTLMSLRISDDYPGTILKDFFTFLEYLGEHQAMLTPAHQLLMNHVVELNARLQHPIQVQLKRPVQKSYPNVQGLYMLARATGITHVDEAGKKPLLVAEEATKNQWYGLNSTELYGNLLEAWLLRGNPELIGEHGLMRGFMPDNFYSAAHFITAIGADGLAIEGNRDWSDRLKYTPGLHNLALMEMFGWIKLVDAPTESHGGWRIERAYRTQVGEALMSALYTGYFEDQSNLYEIEDEGEAPFDELRMVLQPFLTEWRKVPPNEKWTFRDGTHTFKVALGSVWRRIAIGAGQTLNALAEAILEAFEFDNDHLHLFSYVDRYGFQRRISHPYMEEPTDTETVTIGDVPLAVGQLLIFLFDFGDNWEFEVRLEVVDPQGKLKAAQIIGKHGKPPEQYPNWDDMDFDNDED